MKNAHTSKYTPAVIIAGNVTLSGEFKDDAELFRSPKTTSMHIGDFHITFGDVAYPGIAVTAGIVAAYAEAGLIEDGLTPSEVVQELLIQPGLFDLVLGTEALREMCFDALRRGLADKRFTGVARMNTEHTLKSLQQRSTDRN